MQALLAERVARCWRRQECAQRSSPVLRDVAPADNSEPARCGARSSESQRPDGQLSARPGPGKSSPTLVLAAPQRAPTRRTRNGKALRRPEQPHRSGNAPPTGGEVAPRPRPGVLAGSTPAAAHGCWRAGEPPQTKCLGPGRANARLVQKQFARWGRSHPSPASQSTREARFDGRRNPAGPRPFFKAAERTKNGWGRGCRTAQACPCRLGGMGWRSPFFCVAEKRGRSGLPACVSTRNRAA